MFAIQKLRIPGEAPQDPINLCIRSLWHHGMGNVFNMYVGLWLLINKVEHSTSSRTRSAGMSVWLDVGRHFLGTLVAVNVLHRSDTKGATGSCDNLVPILCHTVCTITSQGTGCYAGQVFPHQRKSW